MPQTITEELSLIIRTQADQAIAALKEYEKNIGDVSVAAEDLAKTQENVVEQTDKLGESTAKQIQAQSGQADSAERLYGGYMKVVGAYAAVMAAASKVLAVVNEMREAGEANVLTGAKLQAVLDATGRSAEISVRQYGRWATELRKATGVSEQEIMDMGAQLSVFGNIGSDILPEILERSVDLSKLWGEALPSSAKKLGRAIEDPLKGMSQLEESGVMLDTQAKKNITSLMEAGKTAEAQRILLDALEQRVGGVASSMMDAIGPAQSFRTSLAEIKGEIGEDLLNIPGLELVVRALDSYLDGRKVRKSLKELFATEREGGLQDMLSGMTGEDLQITLGLVLDSQAKDVAQTFRANFDATKQSIIDALMTQIELRKQLDEQHAAEAAKATEQAALEKATAAELAKQKQASTDLQAAYALTETGRKKALQTEVETLRKQQATDKSLIEASRHDPEVDASLLKQAKARIGLYDAVIETKQKEIDGIDKTADKAEENYISKLFGGAGKDAKTFVVKIPVSYDFNRSSREKLEAELSAVKSQIEKVWSAGPAKDDAGEWRANLDILVAKYDELKPQVDAVTKLEKQRTRSQELRESLLTDEQKQQKALMDLQKELDTLEGAKLLTHEERIKLWDREYEKVNKIKSLSKIVTDEFDAMGKSLYDQFFKADAMGSRLSGTFSGIGDALTSGESGAEAFSESMGDFFQQMTGQISSLCIAAGLRMIVEGGWAGLPIAIGLFALGGVAGLMSGAMGGSKGVDETILKSMEDELDARQKLAETINSSIDTEYELLKRQLDRNLISVEEFRSGAGDLQGQRNYADAQVGLSQAIQTQISSLDSELSGMSGWDKFWSGRDEEIGREVAQLKALFDSIDSSSVEELRNLQATLKNMGVAVGSVPAFATGGEFMTTGPRLILVGDNPSGREHVKVTPIERSVNGNETGDGQQTVVYIQGDIFGIEDLYGKLRQVGIKAERRRA